MNFKAALERREIEQSIEGAPDMAPDTGNAFSGSKAVMDRETMYAIDNALMNDDDGAEPSSIGNAALMLAGKFAAAASKKEKEKSRQMMWEVLMQKMLDDLNERLAEIDGQLEALDQIKQMMAAGTFDPAEDANHLALLQQVDPTMTLERWDAMSDKEQNNFIVVTQNQLNLEKVELQDVKTNARALLDSNPTFPLLEAMPVTNNSFDNKIFENATVQAELYHSIGIDRHNLSEEDLGYIMDFVKVGQEQDNIEATINLDKFSNIPNEIDTLANFDLGIKL